MGGEPGVGVAVLIEIPTVGGIDADMAQGGDLIDPAELIRAEMGGVVEHLDREAPALIPELCNSRVVEDGHRLRVVERAAQHPGQQAADRDAVGGDDDSAVGIGLSDLTQGFDGAFLYVVVGLGPRHGEVFRVTHEACDQLRLLPEDVGEGLRLPAADVDLTQARVGLDGQIVKARDGGGGKARTVEVAGIHRIDRDIPKAKGESLHLLPPHGGDVPVPVPLHVPVEVPLCLNVPNYINFCHKSASRCLTAAVGYSIIVHIKT